MNTDDESLKDDMAETKSEIGDTGSLPTEMADIDNIPSEMSVTETLTSQTDMLVDDQIPVEQSFPATEAPSPALPTTTSSVISKLPSHILPSNENVVQYYKFIKQTTKLTIDPIGKNDVKIFLK